MSNKSVPERRPNIMLLQGEDVGRHLGCYGDPDGRTPNLDRLAAEGARYTKAYSHAPVCAPSRGGMVTGCYPWSIGNHLMRCRLQDPPRCFTHELREAGYHVSWPTKLDFNFEPAEGWCDDTDPWWEKDAPDGPFFVYRNFGLTHESRMFREPPRWHGPMPELPEELRHRLEEVTPPPHLPDTPELRQQLVAYHDALSAIDLQVGECLRWLDEQGRREDTLVIFLTDHGRGLPREKRWCYDAGVHLPLILRWPGRIEPGSVVDDLVAWVDIAPTLLSLAGAPVPEHYQGEVFLGDDRAPGRQHVFFGRDRMDGVFDKVRGASDGRWHYIRNDAPGLPWAQLQDFMEQQPVMPVTRRMWAEGKLEGDAAVFFQRTKPREELYDIENDPNMVRNLSADPEHAATVKRLRGVLERQLAATGDLGETDEHELVARGVVDEQIEEYRKRHELLPPELRLGPELPPVTLNEATEYLASD
jgi:uncharacterized sulfatase